jgi:hypothetical protein
LSAEEGTVKNNGKVVSDHGPSSKMQLHLSSLPLSTFSCHHEWVQQNCLGPFSIPYDFYFLGMVEASIAKHKNKLEIWNRIDSIGNI